MAREEIKKEKREYQKPKLTTIELNVDEVLAIGCKFPPGPGNPIGFCMPQSCRMPGS
jgi:hypothetical protein